MDYWARVTGKKR